MIFPITTIAILVCLVWAWITEGRRSPLFIALAVWALGVLAVSAPVFTYAVPYSVKADLFVAACLGALTAFYRGFRAPPREPPVPANLERQIRLAKVLGVAGIVGCVLLVVSSGTNLSVRYLLQNLASIRSAGFDSLENPGAGSPVTVLGAILGSCSMLSVIVAARLGRAGGRAVVVLGVVNFFSIAAVGLFVYAGRTTLFYVASLVLISMFLSGRKILRASLRTVLVVSLVLVSGWYFSVSWVQSRERRINPEAILADTQRAAYRDWLAPIARQDEALGVALVSLGYAASPLPSLAFYIENGDPPGPFWGAYSYPLPTRLVESAAGVQTPRPWIDIRQEVFAPYESSGYLGNVYATWLRDLLIDFGYLGAFVFCCLFGGFMAMARNAFERTGALHYHCFEVLACFTFAFGAFAGVLFFTFLSTAFFLTFAMMFAARVTFSEVPTGPSNVTTPKPGR